MYNKEKEDDFQNLQSDWCEDWIEEWIEVWYDEASFDIKQTPQYNHKKSQPTANTFKRDSELEDAHNNNSIDEKYEYTEETTSHKDHQDKSKSNFLDYVDELESAFKYTD